MSHKLTHSSHVAYCVATYPNLDDAIPYAGSITWRKDYAVAATPRTLHQAEVVNRNRVPPRHRYALPQSRRWYNHARTRKVQCSPDYARASPGGGRDVAEEL